MCTVKIQFILWFATETVRFHRAEMSFCLEDILSHLVGQSEQFDAHEKFPGGCKSPAILCRFFVHLTYSPY